MKPPIGPTASVIDPRIRRILAPTRVVWSSPGSGSIENPNAVIVDDPSLCTMTPGSDPTNPPSIIIDFGCELNGSICVHVEWLTEGKTSTRVRVRFGESVSEMFTTPMQDHACHDFTYDQSFLSRQEIGMTGFRFARIDLVDPAVKMTVRYVNAVAVEQPYELVGRFESSDPLLDEIWHVGARTAFLCCQDYILDGIKRDRLAWMGDTHPQVHILAAAYGAVPIIPKTLDYFIEHSPLTNGWANGMPSYSMWWIESVWDWFQMTADESYLRSASAHLKALVEQVDAHIGSDGLVHFPIEFLEWGTPPGTRDVCLAQQPMSILGMSTAEKIFSQINDTASAARARAVADRLRTAPIEATQSKAIHAIRAMANMIPAADAAALFAKDPFTSMSPWFGYYMMNVWAEVGGIDACLEIIRKYWGGMLQLGATSFWESFDVKWMDNASRIDEMPVAGKHDVHKEYGEHCYIGHRHSLCHGWGGGPTAWLSRYVLGVESLAPGFAKVRITPNLGNLTFARGAVPTPKGAIVVEHRRDAAGKIQSTVTLPKGIELAK